MARYLASLIAVLGLLGSALAIGLLTTAHAGYVGMPLWANSLILGAKATSRATTTLVPSRVQGCVTFDRSGGSLSTYTCVMSAGVGGNNVAAFTIGYGDANNDLVSVVDDKGDSCDLLDYVAYTTVDYSNNSVVCENLTAGATTFTVTLSSAQTFTMILGDEIHNVSFVDVHAIQTNSGTGTNGLISSSVTTSQNGEFIWAAAGPAAGAISAGTGFTVGTAFSDTSVLSEHLTQATAGAINATFTQASSGEAGVPIIAFLPTIASASLTLTLQGIYSHSSLLLGVSWCNDQFCSVSSGSSVTSVTDNNSNTWTQKGIVSGIAPISVWGAPQVSNSVSSNEVITVNWSAAAQGPITLYGSEWRNAAGVFEVVNTNTQSPVTSLSVATNGNTSRAREIVYGFGRAFSGCITPGQTAINGAVADGGVTDEYQVGVVAGQVYTNTFANCSSSLMNGIVLGLY